MALRWVDSFDTYATADLTERYTFAFSTVAIAAGAGRRGTNSLRAAGNGTGVQRIFDARSSWIMGFAVRTTALPSSSHCRLVSVLDAGTTQCELRLTNTGAFQVARGATVLGTSGTVIAINTFAYIEWLYVIDNTAGVMRVRVNGSEVITVTGADTQNTANATANGFNLGQLDTSTGLGTTDFDDLYVCDTSGSSNNTFLGECRVDVLLPSADGTYTAWAPSTGTAHYAVVDETPPNDDTDYLSTATAAAREAHQLTNMPAITSPEYKGLMHTLTARKDDAATRQLKSLLLSGATTQAGSVTHTLTTSYAAYSQIWETDPNTGAAWTESALNALEAGVEHQ